MRRSIAAAILAPAAAACLLATAVPANAATGTVTFYTQQFDQLAAYTNPTGCQAVPNGAASLQNETNKTISLYWNSDCRPPVVLVIVSGQIDSISDRVKSFMPVESS
ncbi:hypothetical protein [Nonomuraea gerenzanensis]|uniref:Secreted protein n=1 Tax=Nonomuraea gerenzanensis TaxID=93944 RepID=A0A1M4EMM1_9ACTN|nr:hypothetical protein [Nonomuraea gerenzanensis]UBU11594.1 hypothetical protein LCN96_46025 [Nonomuraea gerenzanensis]SBP00089.1 hypothetical protein BN4615_P9605 [Nonomuraea gerenzanensis]